MILTNVADPILRIDPGEPGRADPEDWSRQDRSCRIQDRGSKRANSSSEVEVRVKLEREVNFLQIWAIKLLSPFQSPFLHLHPPLSPSLSFFIHLFLSLILDQHSLLPPFPSNRKHILLFSQPWIPAVIAATCTTGSFSLDHFPLTILSFLIFLVLPFFIFRLLVNRHRHFNHSNWMMQVLFLLSSQK